MSEHTRQEIETNIRKLSKQLSDDIIRQQKEKNIIPGRVDLTILQAMLDQWGELVEYYEHNLHHEENAPDLDISIYIVSNFVHWKHSLLMRLRRAENEALNRLEYSMNCIIKAASVLDEFFH